jgi:hypothetical protein
MESESVKSGYSKYLKHRLAESRYSAYDWSGAIAPAAALVQGVQLSCVST